MNEYALGISIASLVVSLGTGAWFIWFNLKNNDHKKDMEEKVQRHEEILRNSKA